MTKWETKRFLTKTCHLSLPLLSLLRRRSPGPGPTMDPDPHGPEVSPQPAARHGFGNFFWWGCKDTQPLQELHALPDHSGALKGFRFLGVQMVPAIVSVTVRDGHLRNGCGTCFISQDWTNPWKHATSAHFYMQTTARGNHSKLLKLHWWLWESYCRHQPGRCWTICYSRSRCQFSSFVTADGYYCLLEISLPLMANQWAWHHSERSCRSVVKLQQLASLPFVPNIAAYFPTSSLNSLLIELLLFWH